MTNDTQLPYGAFYNCVNLTSVILSENVTNVEKDAFYGCSGLTSVTYTGTCAQAREISIGNNNQLLTNAEWSYASVKTEDHVYDNTCDATCNVCGHEREIEHTYTYNEEHTCEACKYSRTPCAPVLKDKSSGQFEVVLIEGMEYSLNGTTWQDNPRFADLEGSTTYTVYQRVKASAVADESGVSEPLTVTLKASQQTPAAPTVLQYTDTTVTLMAVSGCEYSIDGVHWQSGTQFTGLLPNTTYTVYQRVAGTATAEPSAATAQTVTTDRSVQTQIPSTPTVESVTTSSVTLHAIDGCEYSKNGTSWQSSPIFTGLDCGTAYIFYQRYMQTDTAYAGKASAGMAASTDKGTTSTPSAPTLLSKTYCTVTLTTTDGYEYSMDGVTWQTNSTFTGLNASTNYVFFRRKAESARYYASAASAPLTVRTADTPVCVEDGHTYQNNCDTNCDVCGEIRVPSDHEYDNACDKTCNVCGATRSFSRLEVVKHPNKLTYTEGEALDVTGLVVTAYYNNGTSADVTDYTISGYSSTPGMKTITVSYGGSSDTFDVIVEAKKDGWVLEGSYWFYYLGGVKTTGWQCVNNTWYYLNGAGVMQTGWLYVSNTWYYLNEGGAMQTGWLYVNNTWYYLNEGGAMTTGWQCIGGTWYYMNAGGAMTTGWLNLGGTWYYMNAGGAMTTGWLNLGGTWYYMNEGGAMTTGWQYIGNTWYYMNEGGAMQTGWLQLGGVWYFLADGGAMQTGWQMIGGVWYYFYDSGAMAVNCWIGNYWINAGGVWVA
ncbi:MAG: bacterial Ig-like domain-containing protein [Clostridia bacterium]|nr:bacterial Ig-like domain-containing protein [Clostridia bacterium]